MTYDCIAWMSGLKERCGRNKFGLPCVAMERWTNLETYLRCLEAWEVVFVTGNP